MLNTVLSETGEIVLLLTDKSVSTLPVPQALILVIATNFCC